MSVELAAIDSSSSQNNSIQEESQVSRNRRYTGPGPRRNMAFEHEKVVVKNTITLPFYEHEGMLTIMLSRIYINFLNFVQDVTTWFGMFYYSLFVIFFLSLFFNNLSSIMDSKCSFSTSKYAINGFNATLICLDSDLRPRYLTAIPTRGIILISNFQSHYLFSPGSKSLAGLYAYSIADKKVVQLWPRAFKGSDSKVDLIGDERCQSPPVRNFEPLGTSLFVTLADGYENHYVAAVAFSEPNGVPRHAIELYSIKGRSVRTTLTWVGCIPYDTTRVAVTAFVGTNPEDERSFIAASAVTDRFYMSTTDRSLAVQQNQNLPYSRSLKKFVEANSNHIGKVSWSIYNFLQICFNLMMDPSRVVLHWLGQVKGFVNEAKQDPETGEYHSVGRNSVESPSDAIVVDNQYFFVEQFACNVCKIEKASPICANVPGASLEGLVYWRSKNSLIVLSSGSYHYTELCVMRGIKDCIVPWSLYEVDIDSLEISKMFQHDGSILGAATSMTIYKNKVIIGSKTTNRLLGLTLTN
jgi:hypothetical protein